MYVVATDDPPPYPQMDLRGIKFEIQLRRRPADNEVILGGSSLSGQLTVGAAPNYGHLIWYFPRDVMRTVCGLASMSVMWSPATCASHARS